MKGMESVLIERSQWMVNQAIVEYGGSLSQNLENSVGALGEETSVAHSG